MFLSIACLLAAQIAPAPIHQYRLTAEQIEGQSLKPIVGDLRGTIAGAVRFGDDSAKALIFDGDAKRRHGIVLTDNLAQARLPAKDISVEAWVRVDRGMEWCAFVGALQDNGAYEKGWILGLNKSQFCFGLIGSKSKTITYLKANTEYQKGYWYHVVGVYDGAEQKLFVNGKLVGSSNDQVGDIAYPPKTWVTLGVYKDDDEHHPLAGQMREAAIWNVALTPAQIAERFEAAKRKYPNMDAVLPVVADWPMFLRDNTRSGTAPETTAPPLHRVWSHRTRLAPLPAWPEEAVNDYWNNKYNMEERVTFDRGFHLVGSDGRLYFGSSSEDAVFCLDAESGREIWRFTAEGPVRLAPTVVDGRLVFGSDDGHVYCLDAARGTLLWKQLVAPTPRRLAGNGRIISAWPVRTDVFVDKGQCFVAAGVFPSQGVHHFTLDFQDGSIKAKKPLNVTAQGYQQRMFGKLMVGTGRNPAGGFATELQEQGRPIDKTIVAIKDYPFSFISTGETRWAGGDGKLAAFDGASGKLLWSTPVDGRVYSLIAMRGQLYASTDRGVIYRYSAKAPGQVVDHRPIDVKPEAPASKVADEVLAGLGKKRRGYALLLGKDTSVLLAPLLIRTEMQLVIRESSKSEAENLRNLVQKLGASGRVAVHQGELSTLPYNDSLFNVVVTEAAVRNEALAAHRDEFLRVVRPHGGLALLGAGDRFVGKEVVGEGEWTHQYGDAGNTACSRDERLKGELELQWFGKPGPRGMIDRHHRTAAPLASHGRLFVPGEDMITAVDSYNGTILWERKFPDSRRVIILRDASYLALDPKRLYVAHGDRCAALDLETGETIRTLQTPDGFRGLHWGYVGRPGGNSASVLLGSAVKPGSSRQTQSLLVDRTETYYDFVPMVGSDGLFAANPETGKAIWSYRAKGLIPNPTIAADEKAVYFLESKNPKTLEGKLGRAKLHDLARSGIQLVSLDLKTGAVRWRQDLDLSRLDHIVYVTCADGHVVVSGSRNNGKDKKTAKVWYDLYVHDAATGKEKWAVSQDQNVPVGGDHGEQDQHPVVIGQKLYQEPYGYDLASGTKLDFKLPWAGRSRRGCGNLSASASQFFFRDGNVSMFDMDKGSAKTVTTETRPGCWINLLPVGGMLLAPEASSGCSCNFAVQTSFALTPKR